MSAVRRTLLTLLPKVAMSRLTGLVTRTPLPRPLRAPAYRWFARRYGAELGDVDRELGAFRSLAEFFARPLRPGARPVEPAAALVWPCDGRIVTAGPLDGDRVAQVKGQDYALAELLGDDRLARALRGGSQATVYLAPGDYHRVHAPFAGTLRAVRRIGGTLFPVNPPAVRSIPRLFVRNARTVFELDTAQGPAAVVMVGALNVGDVTPLAEPRAPLAAGDPLGAFGFGSTVVAITPPGAPPFPALERETRVRAAATVV